jgi:hypothetical protein
MSAALITAAESADAEGKLGEHGVHRRALAGARMAHECDGASPDRVVEGIESLAGGCRVAKHIDAELVDVGKLGRGIVVEQVDLVEAEQRGHLAPFGRDEEAVDEPGVVRRVADRDDDGQKVDVGDHDLLEVLAAVASLAGSGELALAGMNANDDPVRGLRGMAGVGRGIEIIRQRDDVDEVAGGDERLIAGLEAGGEGGARQVTPRVIEQFDVTVMGVGLGLACSTRGGSARRNERNCP